MLKVKDLGRDRRFRSAEGLDQQTITKKLDIARNTVKGRSPTRIHLVYRRQRRPSAVDPDEDQIRAVLMDCLVMPATVFGRAHRVDARHDLKERVAELRRWSISAVVNEGVGPRRC